MAMGGARALPLHDPLPGLLASFLTSQHHRLLLRMNATFQGHAGPRQNA
jgi:hypothetical protein